MRIYSESPEDEGREIVSMVEREAIGSPQLYV